MEVIVLRGLSRALPPVACRAFHHSQLCMPIDLDEYTQATALMA
jgi:hypothetical protein